MQYDTLIRNATVIDGSNTPGYRADVAILNGRIERIGDLHDARATEDIDAAGRVLAPGFIDVHTHDDTVVIRQPEMLPKLSQGVTTVIVGNCGISASPVSLQGNPPDPMNLLGTAAAFVYPRFSDYRAAVEAANTTLNVAALVGHTALRSNHLDDLLRTATPDEIAAMREQLRESLEAGALGLSTGLAYASAFNASTDEVKQLTEELTAFGAVYTTHLRSEFEPVLEAMDEAFSIGRHSQSPVIISHLKCAGVGNWAQSAVARIAGGSGENPACGLRLLSLRGELFDAGSEASHRCPSHHHHLVDAAPRSQRSRPDRHRRRMERATARRRQTPATGGRGVLRHGRGGCTKILAHPLSMVGSDGLPEDPFPHPRLWALSHEYSAISVVMSGCFRCIPPCTR